MDIEPSYLKQKIRCDHLESEVLLEEVNKSQIKISISLKKQDIRSKLVLLEKQNKKTTPSVKSKCE